MHAVSFSDFSRAADEFLARRNFRRCFEVGARSQNPNLFCIKRRKDSAHREFQSCMGPLRFRADGLATRHAAEGYTERALIIKLLGRQRPGVCSRPGGTDGNCGGIPG